MNTLELWRSDRSPFTLLRNLEQTDRTVAPCDVEEDDKSFHLSFDLPGFKKEDVTIELLSNRLTVSGKRQREASSSEAKFHRIERSYGEFKRVFTLPQNAKGETMEAIFENGVLSLLIPKAEVERPKKVEISETRRAV